MQTTVYQAQLQAFTDYLAFEKRFSGNTVTAYKNDLEQFFAFLEKEFDAPVLSEVKSPFVRTWLAGLMDKDFIPTTVKRKISTLKAFFKYQVKTGQLQSSPMLTIIAPKAGKRLPQYVQQKETELLFKHVAFSEGFEGQTEELILELLYNTGIRLSELIHIKESDVDQGQKSLKVLGKGNKERIVPLGSHLIEKIRRYISVKSGLNFPAAKQYLLVTSKGKKMYAKYVYLIVKKYLGLITTLEKRSPHILRHTFATHLTNKGADLNAVKELLGHSSLASTQVYTHNNIEKLKDVYKKAHPGA